MRLAFDSQILKLIYKIKTSKGTEYKRISPKSKKWTKTTSMEMQWLNRYRTAALTQLGHYQISIPPENVRKPNIF